MISFKRFLMEKVMQQFNVLKHTDLTKDRSRAELFVMKIKTGEDFALANGKQTKIDKSEYDDVAAGMNTKGFSKKLKIQSGGYVNYPKDFLKTGEFGGKGKGSGVAAENAALKLATTALNKVLTKEAQPTIMLKVGKRTVECAGIISTPNPGGRDPKSDFAIVNLKGDMVAHISHKAGRTAKDFQQYGGVTDLKGNKEIESFMKDVIAKHPGGLGSGDTYYRKIKSNDLIQQSVYGIKAGSKSVDVNNVDEFHQGTMQFKKKGGAYIITSTHKGIVGQTPKGPYEAILVARYNKRKGTYGSLILQNSRIGIFPMAKITKNTKEI